MNKQYESYLAGSLKSVLESIEEAIKMPSEITNLYKAANESLSNSEYHCLENKKKCLEELNNAQSYLKKLISKVSSLNEEAEEKLDEAHKFVVYVIPKGKKEKKVIDTLPEKKAKSLMKSMEDGMGSEYEEVGMEREDEFVG